jgi:phenylacetate-CoA ligase
MTRLSILISDLLKGQNTLHYLNHFERFRYATGEEIKAYQFNRLKELLIHCEQNVPFYRRRFRESGFSAGGFSSMAQMKVVPPLTRQDLQEHWKDIIAVNYRDKRLHSGSSGGSTGQPVSYRKDSHATSAGQAAHLLGWSLSGWKMSMKGLHIWGNPATVNEEWGRLSSKMKARIFRHHKFPAYRLNDGTRLNELYQLIKKQKYDYIDGYTNAIYHFAGYLKARGLSFDHKIKFVLTTAENLHDFQRRTIEETIGPIFDTYGCSEINSIAYECSQCKQYHIMDPHVCLEFGKPLESFGTAPLIITDLDNFAFPLVRYMNGDLGIPAGRDAGECDLNFSVMTAVSGRETDLIKLKDGGVLSVPSFFGSMLLRKVNGLIQYQVEKVSEDMLHINLVTSERFTSNDLETVESALKEYINGQIGYSIRYVDAIDVSGSGKFKLVIDRTVL